MKNHKKYQKRTVKMTNIITITTPHNNGKEKNNPNEKQRKMVTQLEIGKNDRVRKITLI